MDIWKWVDDLAEELEQQGQHRLAYLIYAIPHYTCENDHTLIDALIPEALALARSMENTWLEVFFRHWNLQSHLFHRYEVAGLMPEAVKLLEFAHREENRQCPQSICAVQDFTKCYGLLDGPGYVEERLNVLTETFEKIDPRWPCFLCLTGEYLEALCDGGRFEEALAFLEQQEKALLLEGQRVDLLNINYAETLIELQRFDEAYEYAKKSHQSGGGKDFALRKTITLARIAAHQERLEQAKQKLPEFEEIAQTHAHYKAWAETACLLATQGAIPNDWHLNRTFQYMADELSQHGVLREAIMIIKQQAELALQRGRPITAQRCCETIEHLIPRLRKPLDVPDLLAALRSKVISALDKRSQKSFPFETPEQVLQQLGEDDPELNLDVLEGSRTKWPEHEHLATTAANAWYAIGDKKTGFSILKEYLEQYPDSPDAILVFGYFHLADGKDEELQTFALSMLEKNPSPKVYLHCEWLLALLHHKLGELDTAKHYLLSIVEKDSEALNAKRLLAELERKTGDLEAALQHIEQLIEKKHDVDDCHWDRMVVATLLEDWEKVRHSATHLGIELTGEGPIDENFGLCRIQFTDAQGEKELYYAVRTGPVTARIIEIAHPDLEQHFHDELVFDPVPLNSSDTGEQEQQNEEVPETDDEHAQEGDIPLFACIRVTTSGGYESYILDGVHPAEEKIQHLQDTLDNLQCHFQVRSDDTYEIQLDDDSETMPGLYGYLAVPEPQSLKEVERVVSKITGLEIVR